MRCFAGGDGRLSSRRYDARAGQFPDTNLHLSSTCFETRRITTRTTLAIQVHTCATRRDIQFVSRLERLSESQASAIELGPDGAEDRVERLCKNGCKIQLRVNPGDHKLCHIKVPASRAISFRLNALASSVFLSLPTFACGLVHIIEVAVLLAFVGLRR